MGQKRTHAAQQKGPLFDRLVGGNVDAECFGRPQIDEHFDFSGGLLDWQISVVNPVSMDWPSRIGTQTGPICRHLKLDQGPLQKGFKCLANALVSF